MLRPRLTAIAVVVTMVGLTGLIAAPAGAISVETIQGHIRDAVARPLANVAVTDGNQVVYTDATGFYSLSESSVGTYQVSTSRIGLDPLTRTVNPTDSLQPVDFVDTYVLRGVISLPAVSTASGPATDTVTITSYAPSAVVALTDSRTQIPGHAALLYTNKDGSTSWESPINLPQGSTEGLYSLTFVADDASTGTAVTATKNATYRIDNTPPTLTDPIPLNLANVTTLPFTISAFANDAGSGVNNSSAQLSIDGQSVSGASAASAGGGAVISTQLSTLATGRHTVTAKVADNAGNVQLLTWTVNVTSFATSAPTVGVPPDTASVPTPYTPGSSVTMNNVDLQLGSTEFSMPSTGHPGFGLLCGSVDLTHLQAKFTSLTGGALYSSPTTPPPNVVCAYVSNLATDPSEPFSQVLAGWAPVLGNLTFPIPATTQPGSTATLVINGPTPLVNWTAPSYTVNAAGTASPPVSETVSDPVLNQIDPTTAAAARSDLDQREASFFSSGAALEGSDVEPSLWALSGGKWSTAGPVVDRSLVYPSPQYAASLTSVSGYGTGGGATLLYRQLSKFTPSVSPNGSTSTIEQYFRWGTSYVGMAGQATYLPLTWTAFAPATASTAHMFDVSSTDVTNSSDDGGHAISWDAPGPNGASNTYGDVRGLEQAFTLGGQQDLVTHGWMDDSVALNCAYCMTYANAVQDSSQTETFQVVGSGPAVAASGQSAVPGTGVSPQGYSNCVGQSGAPASCKPPAGSAGPNYVSLSASSSSVAVGTPVVLTASANGDVSSSPFYIEIADASSGSMIKICGSGSSCSVTADQYQQTTHSYVAYVAGYNNSNPPPEIQAQSGSLSVQWYPWSATLTASTTSAVPTGFPIQLTASANGNVAAAGYFIDIYDQTANSLVGSTNSGNSLTIGVNQVYSTTHTYVAYVATNNNANPPPAGVQATSGQVSATWQSSLWSTSASAQSTSVSNGSNATLTANTNYDVGPTPFYIDLFDQTDNSPIGMCGSGTSCSSSEGGFYNTSHSFLAYVANAFYCPSGCSNAGPPGNIQATSGSVTVTWGTTMTVSLAASANSVTAGTTVTLTAYASLDVGPTPYWIEIYDENTGGQVAVCGSGTSCSAYVSESYAATQTYIAYIAANSATMPPPSIQATSGTQTITWGGGASYTVSLSETPIGPAGGQAITLTASANTSVSYPYYIEIFDQGSGSLLADCSGLSCAASASYPAYATDTFVAYVSNYGTTMPPPGTQAISDALSVSWGESNISTGAPWGAHAGGEAQIATDASGATAQDNIDGLYEQLQVPGDMNVPLSNGTPSTYPNGNTIWGANVRPMQIIATSGATAANAGEFIGIGVIAGCLNTPATGERCTGTAGNGGVYKAVYTDGCSTYLDSRGCSANTFYGYFVDYWNDVSVNDVETLQLQRQLDPYNPGVHMISYWVNGYDEGDTDFAMTWGQSAFGSENAIFSNVQHQRLDMSEPAVSNAAFHEYGQPVASPPGTTNYFGTPGWRTINPYWNQNNQTGCETTASPPSTTLYSTGSC